jgi:hypothetical protein
MASALSRGYVASPTFRALVDALERSDVIVHVMQRWLRPGEAAGATSFVVRAGGPLGIQEGDLHGRYTRCGRNRQVATRSRSVS